MKKSTLITTLAMIVVVVVALSTATYAWFTAGQVTTETVSMSTNATSFLSLAVKKNVTSSTDWSTADTGTGIALTSENRTGLWAPISTIDAAVTFSESTVAATTGNFYQASHKSNNTAAQTTANTEWGMDVMRITNVSDVPRSVYLYVVIAVDGNATNANNLYAAQATSFYINCKYFTNDANHEGTATNKTATNGYGKDDDTVTNANEAILPKGGNAGVQNLAEVALTSGASPVSLTARPTYNGLTTSGFFHSAANESLGISEGQYVLIYCVQICNCVVSGTEGNYTYAGGLAQNESIILGAYTWIDGWTANNAAGNAAFNVTYAFTTDAIQLTAAA